ncbi:MAG: arsenic resistance N-acetyltransferase ArsN2 [Thermoanaerobaculia bacterium]
MSASPLACRLDALNPEEGRRHAELASKLAARSVGVEELPDGFAVVIPAEPESLGDAAEWMALEARCCPFLHFALTLEAPFSRAMLRLAGPEGAKEVLRSEIAALANGRPAGAVEIGPLRREELPALLRLLEKSKLPIAGVEDHLDTALAAREGGRLVGSAVLEIYGQDALLRSVAVDPELRGRGLGLRLAGAALALAAERGPTDVFLLTETASEFFPRLGFREVPRSGLPASLDSSAELRGACPARAVAMARRLSAPGNS